MLTVSVDMVESEERRLKEREAAKARAKAN